MARFATTLGDQMAALAETTRTSRTAIMTVPELAPIGPELLAENAVRAEHLAENAVTMTALDTELTTNLNNLNTSLAAAEAAVQATESQITDVILPAINDAAASPITNDRFTSDSLTVWPFVGGSIPQGALAPGAIGTGDIADFSIVVRKLKDSRHHLY